MCLKGHSIDFVHVFMSVNGKQLASWNRKTSANKDTFTPVLSLVVNTALHKASFTLATSRVVQYCIVFWQIFYYSYCNCHDYQQLVSETLYTKPWMSKLAKKSVVSMCKQCVPGFLFYIPARQPGIYTKLYILSEEISMNICIPNPGADLQLEILLEKYRHQPKIKHKALKCLFTGPPQVGKTTLKKRLLKAIKNLISSGVVDQSGGLEKSITVVIGERKERDTVIIESDVEWQPQHDLLDEAQIVLHFIDQQSTPEAVLCPILPILASTTADLDQLYPPKYLVWKRKLTRSVMPRC